MINKWLRMNMYFQDLKKDERGVTAIEYGLIAAAMAVMLLAIFDGSGTFVTAIKNVFSSISSMLGAAGS